MSVASGALSYHHPRSKPDLVGLLNPAEDGSQALNQCHERELQAHTAYQSYHALSFPSPTSQRESALRSAQWNTDSSSLASLEKSRHAAVTAVSGRSSGYVPYVHGSGSRPINNDSGLHTSPFSNLNHPIPNHPLHSLPNTMTQNGVQYLETRATSFEQPLPRNVPISEHQQVSAAPSSYADFQPCERTSLRLAVRNSSTPLRDNATPPHGSGMEHYPVNSLDTYQPQYDSQVDAHSEQESSRKRSFPADEDGHVARLKKQRKNKTTGGETASTKRGFNAKKRSDMAQIAASTVQSIPAEIYSYVNCTDGLQEDVTHPLNGEKLVIEVQTTRCMSNRYRNETFPKCVSCTRRWAGDTCRFQGIRLFLKDESGGLKGVSFQNTPHGDVTQLKFPESWNTTLTEGHVKEIKVTTARALLPVLEKELEHISHSDIMYRPRESEVRATCDGCITSLFSTGWMCRLCGREFCSECFEECRSITDPPPNASSEEKLALQSRRDMVLHKQPFFLTCSKRRDHGASDFLPVSRFRKEEVEEAIKTMKEIIESGDSPSAAVAQPHLDLHPDRPSLGHKEADAALQSLSPLTANIPCHTILEYTYDELTEPIFKSHWSKRLPIRIHNLQQKLTLPWTPEFFITQYGDQSCLIIECQNDQNTRVTVKEFFRMFGAYEGRNEVWKLKDWPPSAEFKDTFPDLYEDFSNTVPMPDYVRRDGVLNIASHFPSNTVFPDLGPKMYNALANSQSKGSKGSTRLHMDMADAFNIMTYASPMPDGRPGCAAWDLFRPEDSNLIREFLKKKFKGQLQVHDPIHSQQVYLDEELRKELFEEHNVYSYRVYQRQGEGIFIPAGCAHQVCNLSDCIKIAIDFVSPESIDYCQQLTKEFREQNQSKAWKEDVLQLRSMMWFAWLSCTKASQK